MRKIIILLLIVAPLTILPRSVSAAGIGSLSGRILLQVEDKGQAWYVDPVVKTRDFLGRPADAFAIMRAVGQGITDANLKRIAVAGQPDTDPNFARRLAGRILLQVDQHGEAWYVNPVNLKRYFLGRPADAFALMRSLGLGISNSDLNRIAVNPQYPENTATPPVKQFRDISIRNFSFDPSLLTINPGTTVTWTNLDSAPHQIKSDSFNSSSLSQGQSYSFTFNGTGTFDYSCSIHPSMKGTVIVK